MLNGCSDGWLDTKKLFFNIYSQKTPYVDAEGFESTLGACMNNIAMSFMVMGSTNLQV